MVQRGEDFSFPLESGEPFMIVGEARSQYLDGHVTVELRFFRAIHLTHAALADKHTDFVGAELVAYSQGHVFSPILAHAMA